MHEDLRALDSNRTILMDPRKMQILQGLFKRSNERLKQWLPPGFRSEIEVRALDRWINTWIWSPLSGHGTHPEEPTRGYLALSYVWSDAETFMERDESFKSIIQGYQAGGFAISDFINKGLTASELEMRERAMLGKPATTGQIVVDGVLVEVTGNLERALRALREIPEVQCGKRVWVDALCINQNDLAEKSREVRKMGLIYGKAERVVSWIGNEHDCSGDILEFMNMIGEKISYEHEMAEQNEWFYKYMHDTELGLRLAQLLSRRYWSRIWIAQEVVLGDDKAITICGPRRFSTAKLLTFGVRLITNKPSVVWNREYDLARRPGENPGKVLAAAIPNGLGKLKDLRQLQVNLDMVTTTSMISTFMFRIPSNNFATDPRDIVYGMLNLLPKDLASRLTIDYAPKWSYRDVMVDFASATIHSTESLSWLLFRPWKPFPGWDDWPSWVPNLGLPFSSAHFDWTLGSDCCNGYKSPSEYEIIVNGGLTSFLCGGLYVDTISDATISLASSSRQQKEALLARPDVFDAVIDEATQRSGIPADQLRREIQSAILAIFPEPPPIGDVHIPTSRSHRYGNMQGLRYALTACFEQMNNLKSRAEY